MSKRRAAAATAVIASLVSAAPASAAQQFAAAKKIGQWKIESAYENGSFLYCRAIAKGAGGDISIFQRASGQWALGFPNIGLPKGGKLSGMMELRRGSIPFTMAAADDPRLRNNFVLNNDLLDGLRGGGYIQLQVGGKTYAMQMDDAGSAIGAVSDCRNAALKSPAPPAPPSPGQAAAPGKSVFKTIKNVGPWTIQSVQQDGKFHRCRGAMKVVDDEIAFVRYEKGYWAVTFPNKGWTTGQRLAGSVSFNGQVTPLNQTATTSIRPELKISDAQLQTFRNGGDIVARINGQTFNWHVGVAGEMLGAVQDCWKSNT